jgi:hypothetical protein
MKRRLPVKVLMLPVVLVCYLLISGVPAVAQSENCSNRTLVGNYGFTIEGTTLDANAPIRSLALQHYDGRGHSGNSARSDRGSYSRLAHP